MRRCAKCQGTGRVLVPAMPPRRFTLAPEPMPPESRVELVRVDCPDCGPKERRDHARLH